MRIHVFQHVSFEPPALIADWAKARGHTLRFTRFYDKKYKLPDLKSYDALLILGGPMSVDDFYTHPWLQTEQAHIKQAIKANKYVLGICLGAQLIAKALGAKVKPNHTKEIGWYSVTKTMRGQRSDLLQGLRKIHTVFHWHGDTFELPDGARHLMASKACYAQAFSYGSRVLGLQYHLEMDGPVIETILENCADELTPSLYVQTRNKILKGAQQFKTKEILYKLLDNWAVDAPMEKKRAKKRARKRSV